MTDDWRPERCTGSSHAPTESCEDLTQLAQQTLRATEVFAVVLSDRIAFASATDASQLDGVSADHLVQLIAISDAFQDGACRTLWFIEPELARSARVVAQLARDGVGRR